MEKAPERPSSGEVSSVRLAELEAEVGALKAENAELRRRREELAIVAKSARCLLWHAIVLHNKKDDTFQWNLRVFNDQSEGFVPIEGLPDHSWAQAWYYSRNAEDIVRADRNARDAMLGDKQGYRQEFRCIGKDNEIYWVDEDVRITRKGATEWHLFGVVTDITDRKQAEAELHYAITEARCLLWHAEVYNYAGYLTWKLRIPNERSVREFLPLAIKPDQSWADAWYESKSEEDRRRMDDISRTAILTGKPGYDQEYQCTLKSGEVRWIYEVVRIEKLKSNVWHVVGVCADVTERRKAEDERERLIVELQKALAEVKQLSGLLPICASCKRVRDDTGYWNQIDVYIRSHADVQFSHGICPECMARLYPDDEAGLGARSPGTD